MLRLTGEVGYQGGKDQHLRPISRTSIPPRESSSPALACEWASSAGVNEREAMARALDLAWRGWGRVQPNPAGRRGDPPRDGELVGEGWHPEFGDRHAEAVALAGAGERARGATLVVTLEPCAHQGKQPPCTEAIIHVGRIRRVVAAMRDPNPVAAGGGEQLRAGGNGGRARSPGETRPRQNAIFLHGLRDPSRPFLALKLATTLDGRIADGFGRSRWISGEAARDYVQWLRAGFDAIAVGGRTARLDDPSLTVRGTVRPRVPPKRMVFDRAADLSPQLTLVRTATETPTIVVVAPEADAARVKRLETAGVTVLRAESLRGALATLQSSRGSISSGRGRRSARRGVTSRRAGGPVLLDSSAALAGRGGGPGSLGLPARGLDQAERWRVIERRALGEDTLLVLDRG